MTDSIEVTRSLAVHLVKHTAQLTKDLSTSSSYLETGCVPEHLWLRAAFGDFAIAEQALTSLGA